MEPYDLVECLRPSSELSVSLLGGIRMFPGGYLVTKGILTFLFDVVGGGEKKKEKPG